MSGRTIVKDFDIGELGHMLFTRINVDTPRVEVKQWVEGVYGRGPDHAQSVILDSEALDYLAKVTA